MRKCMRPSLSSSCSRCCSSRPSNGQSGRCSAERNGKSMQHKNKNRPSATSAVDVRGVSKVYDGGVEALNDVSLEFPEGQLTSVLGPSGCGKTTLLKIIAGLIPSTTGEVLVNGKRVTGPGPERAFVFKDFALMPWASVLRTISFGLELRGTPQRER